MPRPDLTAPSAAGAQPGPRGRGPFPALCWIETPRLDLRPLRASDAPHVFAYASQDGFFRHLEHVPERVRTAYTLEDAVAHIAELQSLAATGYPHWAIVPRDLGIPIGAVRFHPADPPIAGLAPEIGYGIGPPWWRRGYASEACHAVLAWARPFAPAVVARCSPANAASQALLRRLAFEATGQDDRGRLVFERT